MKRHVDVATCDCEACVAARSGGPSMKIAIPQSLLDADGALPTQMELLEREAALPLEERLVAQEKRLRELIAEAQATAREERTRRVKLEGQLARAQVESRARIDLDAARRELKAEREVSHEKLVAALRSGVPDMMRLLTAVRDTLDAEMADVSDWSDLSTAEQKRIAGRLLMAIAATMADLV